MLNFKRSAPQIPVVLASLLLWVSFAWGLPAEAPAAEGEADVAPKDPWAGVRISDAYDYAKCLQCGKKNEVRAESCSRCGYELPQPSSEMTDPAWVLVPGRGYHREGTLLEPAKTRKSLLIPGAVLTNFGVLLLVIHFTTPQINLLGLVMTACGVGLIIYGVVARTEPVYAFPTGERYEPFEEGGYAGRSPDSDGVALKVELTVLGF
jgi:ribosomal protein L37E